MQRNTASFPHLYFFRWLRIHPHSCTGKPRSTFDLVPVFKLVMTRKKKLEHFFISKEGMGACNEQFPHAPTSIDPHTHIVVTNASEPIQMKKPCILDKLFISF